MVSPIDHNDEIKQRDKWTKRSLLGFALVMVLTLVIWLAFARYV